MLHHNTTEKQNGTSTLFSEVEIEFNAADCRGKLYLEQGKCRLEVMDTTTGKIMGTELTPIQAGAVMLLFVTGGDEVHNEERWFELVEPLFENWPNANRPIP